MPTSLIRIPGDTRREPSRPVFQPGDPSNDKLVFVLPMTEGAGPIHELRTGNQIALPTDYSWTQRNGISADNSNTNAVQLNLPSWFDISAPWTCMGWYLVNAPDSSKRGYFGLQIPGSTEGLYVTDWDNDNWKITSNGETPGDSGVAVVDGEWVFLALVWDGTVARLYRNGLEIDNVTPTASDWQTATAWMAAGNARDVYSDKFDGAKNARLLARAVPPSEMMEFYVNRWRGLVAPRYIPVATAAAAGLSIPVAMHHYTKNLRAAS